MSSYQDRIRSHMARETKALREAASAARVLDHRGNRGSEVEHALTRWLSTRFAPAHAVSSGELIDSFDTNASADSRQQDAVLHSNTADANRFVLPSGKRLLPIESVVAVIESKLNVDKGKFLEADAKASEVAQLRLRPSADGYIIAPKDRHDSAGQSYLMTTDEQCERGIAVADPLFPYPPVVFALFALEAEASSVATLRRWLDEASTLALVCSLNVGCVFRGASPYRQWDEYTDAEESLTHFGEALASSIGLHDRQMLSLKPNYAAYAPYKPATQNARSQGGGEPLGE